MPAIGDQVATLEMDHAAALAQIDSLTAQTAALTAANTDLQAQLANATQYADEIKSLAASTATAALALVQAAGRSPFVAPAALPPKTSTVQTITAAAFIDPTATLQNNTPEPPAQQAVADIMAGDSGDEQPAGLPPAAPEPDIYAPVAAAAKQSVDAAAQKIETAKTGIFEGVKAAAITDFKAVEAKIEEIPAAVDRMLHHSSAAQTAIRAPVDLTMIVEHDSEGLPIFLRRGTTFDALARARHAT